MQVNQNFHLPTDDHFDEGFKRFQQSTDFKRLQEKFRVRPYFEKYKTLRLTVFASSFLLNAFSAATAFTFVFVFVKAMVPFFILAVCFAIIPLILLEVLKRQIIPSFFKDFFQFSKVSVMTGLFILSLTAVSVTLSYLGAKDVIQLLAKDPVLVDLDSTKAPYLERIAKLEADKDILKQQTWNGKIVGEASKQMTVIQKQIADLEQQMSVDVSKAKTDNEAKTVQKDISTGLRSEYFALVALVLDLVLLLALYWLEYYDFRSLSEFAAGRSTAGTASVPLSNGVAKQNGQPVTP